MITASCFTNIEEYELLEWPEVFVNVPKIGTLVKSKNGNFLEVGQLTYDFYGKLWIELREIK